MQIEVSKVNSDQGSVVVFEGYEIDANGDQGNTVTFAVDHRMASDLVDALFDDETPTIYIEDWQILSISN